MNVTGISELALEAADLDGLTAFYADVVGLRVLAREDDRVWLQVGERARLGLWRPGEKEHGDQGGAHVHFAMTVGPDEIDALAERLDRAGRLHAGPVTHDGGDRSVYWTDPAGNVGEAWDLVERGESTAVTADDEHAERADAA